MTKKNRNNGIFKSVKISIGTMSTVLETSANIIDSLAELVTIQLQA